MRTLKRDNWTNEEVIKILEGRKISSTNPNTQQFVNDHNEGVDDCIEHFREDFACDPNEYNIRIAKLHETKENYSRKLRLQPDV